MHMKIPMNQLLFIVVRHYRMGIYFVYLKKK